MNKRLEGAKEWRCWLSVASPACTARASCQDLPSEHGNVESDDANADPFETLLLPQHIEEELTEGVARVVAFHPSGNLLAGEPT